MPTGVRLTALADGRAPIEGRRHRYEISIEDSVEHCETLSSTGREHADDPGFKVDSYEVACAASTHAHGLLDTERKVHVRADPNLILLPVERLLSYSPETSSQPC